MSESEQNKTEEATPFKLRKAREKGQVARGTDLGFFASMTALCLYAVIAGTSSFSNMAEQMRLIYVEGISNVDNPQKLLTLLGKVYPTSLLTLALFGATIVILVIFFELLQLRGLIFTTQPLKPDFNRLNPAKGLKRLFSMKVLKDALKNIVKMIVYTGASYLVFLYCINLYASNMYNADYLATALSGSGFRLLFTFTLLAVFFAIIDQVISRNEFKKQMRMSKSELKRETKDREGEPRQRQKRKQLHAEFTKQAQNLGELPGSDALIVNPQHYAIGLSYDANKMSAPSVTTKGRNKFAQYLKQQARKLGIPVIESPPLARALYKHAEIGAEIPTAYYRDVANIYLKIRLETNSSKDG